MSDVKIDGLADERFRFFVGNEDEGNVPQKRVRPQAVAQVKSIHTRYHGFTDDCRRGIGLNEIVRRFTVPAAFHNETRALQGPGQQFQGRLIRVHNENAGRFGCGVRHGGGVTDRIASLLFRGDNPVQGRSFNQMRDLERFFVTGKKLIEVHHADRNGQPFREQFGSGNVTDYIFGRGLRPA